MSYSVSQVSALSVVLPASALAICVTYSVAYHSDHSLATHCQTANYLPSISAAVGETSPEKQIWSLFLTVSCALRLILAMAYYQEIRGRLRRDQDCCLTGGHFAVNCLELAALFGLSVVSSSDNFPIHRNCFAIFLISSSVYMLLHLRVCCRLRSRQKLTDRQLISTRSFYIKLISFGVYCLSTALAVYFYMRHQALCERLMYTYFAASEYIVVYMNILFHSTSYFDLSHLSVGLVLDRWSNCVTASFNEADYAFEHSRPWRPLIMQIA
ncbi:hypothetical protein BOX15_Mlig013600g1 [Macrostomum lignano]|uniref:CWH43-like N-terminal domain-containing protein n=1 Tax=Macrostomum lignano TaxID=282301 RepID=A0A267E6Q1_9PLAT|nr:hypothetical protein BOX15_Mlig013600g1 [Macrostomum lignano]